MLKARKGEGEVAFFSAKHWDRRNRAGLTVSTTPYHDAQMMGPYRVSNPLRITTLIAKPEDCTNALTATSPKGILVEKGSWMLGIGTAS